ncbi:FecCD family ABC transporter permease [Desulfoplanes formicivorans]|uniref:ABC transporter permease n=1 Tax=Desulfoplanes formicivorans TaxID=1592317 RepID=A0A194AHE2_9BACT|nr:iron ABC transporter permease [Desulfoplanes formicivorans]GAU08748.1 ABC transporter permease [Desulfoplanes formicivorans]
MLTPWRILKTNLPMALLLVLACWLGLSAGSSGFSLLDPARLFLDSGMDPVRSAIILDLRLPRVCLAVLAGATLSTGGLVMQALLKNPLAEPYILGVSGGAAVGAIGAIILSLAHVATMAISFAGGLASLFLVLTVAGRRASTGTEAILLSGVMINAFCSALILFFISMVPADKAAGVLHWLMGTIPSADPSSIILTLGVVLAGSILIFALAQRMNIFQLGHETAASLGIDVRTTAVILLITITLMVAAVVCQTGLLGFVGLVVPHLLRLVHGHDHRILVPSCILGGGAYMVLCDTLARSLPSRGELPVGVLTAMIGAPLFIFLLTRKRS